MGLLQWSLRNLWDFGKRLPKLVKSFLHSLHQGIATNICSNIPTLHLLLWDLFRFRRLVLLICFDIYINISESYTTISLIWMVYADLFNILKEFNKNKIKISSIFNSLQFIKWCIASWKKINELTALFSHLAPKPLRISSLQLENVFELLNQSEENGTRTDSIQRSWSPMPSPICYRKPATLT